MPTGYTATLHEKDQSFEEFVLTCARAFGACISLRDEPLGSDIPEFAPSDYHKNKIIELKEKLSRTMSATDEELEAEQLVNIENIKQDNIARRMRDIGAKGRYEAMISRVERWWPPTAEHKGLKDFMLEQLRISREQVIHTWVQEVPKLLAPSAYRENMRDTILKEIGYHSEEHSKECKRCADRNQWVKQLKESL